MNVLSGKQRDFYLWWTNVFCTYGEQLEVLKKQVYKDLNSKKGESIKTNKRQNLDLAIACWN